MVLLKNRVICEKLSYISYQQQMNKVLYLCKFIEIRKILNL